MVVKNGTQKTFHTNRGVLKTVLFCANWYRKILLYLPSFGDSSSAVSARMFSCLAVYIFYELRKKEYLFKENRLGQVKGMVNK